MDQPLPVVLAIYDDEHEEIYFAVLWYNMWLAANVKRADELGIDLGDDDEDYPFRGPDVMRAIEEDPADLQIGEKEDLSVVKDKLQAFDPWSEFR